MPKPKTPDSYGPPEAFPRKPLEALLADAILSQREKRALQQEIHWEFDHASDARNKARNKALQQLQDALREAKQGK